MAVATGIGARVSDVLDDRLRATERSGPEYLKTGLAFISGVGFGAVAALSFLILL